MHLRKPIFYGRFNQLYLVILTDNKLVKTTNFFGHFNQSVFTV